MTNHVMELSQRLHLTYYQICVLEHNFFKYDVCGLVKKGGLLYAPYRCDNSKDITEIFANFICGPRADLIGQDKILIYGRRGIRVYTDGCFMACINGKRFHADAFGCPVVKRNFIRAI